MKRNRSRVKTPVRVAGSKRRSVGELPMSPAALKRVGIVLLWVASIGGIGYGLHWLEPYAQAANGAEGWRIEWASVPDTIEPWLLSEIEQESLGKADLPTSVRDPNLCERIGEALAKSSWIEQVEHVTKRSDGVVRIQATFRSYLTYVVKNGRAYLVDGNGVRLNWQKDPASLEGKGWIVIEGVREAVPEPGKPWSGEGVPAGLKLVKFLNDRCPAELRACLRAVDVAQYKDRASKRDVLRIRAAPEKCWILWGLPPGSEEEAEEASAERKLLTQLWTIYTKGDGHLPEHKLIDVRPKDAYEWYDAP